MRAPADFGIPDLPEGVVAKRRPAADPYDTILLFAVTQAELMSAFAQAAERLTVAGGLWVCWPKKASGLQRDLTETRCAPSAWTPGWSTSRCAPSTRPGPDCASYGGSPTADDRQQPVQVRG